MLNTACEDFTYLNIYNLCAVDHDIIYDCRIIVWHHHQYVSGMFYKWGNMQTLGMIAGACNMNSIMDYHKFVTFLISSKLRMWKFTSISGYQTEELFFILFQALLLNWYGILCMLTTICHKEACNKALLKSTFHCAKLGETDQSPSLVDWQAGPTAPPWSKCLQGQTPSLG